MGIERYLKSDEGFRKYVELIESTPPAKRQIFLESAKIENPIFAENVEKYMLTFERITQLPEAEIAEVFGAPALKAQVLALALSSVGDTNLKETLIKTVPRNLIVQVHQDMKDNPSPKAFDVSGAKLKIIQAARDLEKQGKLKSIQIPHFGEGYFKKKAV